MYNKANFLQNRKLYAYNYRITVASFVRRIDLWEASWMKSIDISIISCRLNYVRSMTENIHIFSWNMKIIYNEASIHVSVVIVQYVSRSEISRIKTATVFFLNIGNNYAICFVAPSIIFSHCSARSAAIHLPVSHGALDFAVVFATNYAALIYTASLAFDRVECQFTAGTIASLSLTVSPFHGYKAA